MVIFLYRIRCLWQFFLYVCVSLCKFEYFEFFSVVVHKSSIRKVRLVSFSSRFRIFRWVVNAIWISQNKMEIVFFFRRNDGNKCRIFPESSLQKNCFIHLLLTWVSSLKWVWLFNNFPEFYRNETIQLLANFMDGLLFFFGSLCYVQFFFVLDVSVWCWVLFLQKLSADI